ncbi:MAG TPA: hypothetical protein VIY73_28660 [Polyangiaceae bacterium]
MFALVVAACTSSTQDEAAPACGGTSPENLVSETAPSGGSCPSNPQTLVGTGTEGQSCSSSSDCAPECCPCPGTGTSALVAECNGNCVAGSTACCLYQQQCGQ